MPRERTGEQPFEVGAWRVDPARGVLARDGKEQRLEPKLMELLLLFAASPGRVIGKDEIVASVWDGRAIGDDTLAAAVSRLRAALGATKDERYIETLPKRGYRFLPDTALPAPKPSKSRERSAADDLVRRGHEASRVPLPPALAQARVYFEGAIKLDPKRADAHAGLADVMLAQLMMGNDAPAMLVPTARAAAQAAVALDENLAPAWSVLGILTLFADRDFAAADAALLRAIALDPGLASAHQYRGFALAAIGRFVEAEREARRAVELAPHSLAMRTGLLQSLLLARRYPQAITEAKRTIALSSQAFEAWAAKGWAHHFLGEDDEAVAAFVEHLKAFGSDAATIAKLTEAYRAHGFEACCAAAGDLFESQRVLFVPRPLDIAMLRAFAGQTDEAFAALTVAADRADPVLLLARYLPHLDRLRNDPRFAALMERIRPVA